MGTSIWKWNHYCGEGKLKEQAGFFLVGAGHACPGVLERPACEKAHLIATGFIHLSSMKGSMAAEYPLQCIWLRRVKK